MLGFHDVIKFWARKPVELILNEAPMKMDVVADPFCGSGTTGFVGLFGKSDQIYLSDLSSVSIFITSTLLSKVMLSEEIFTHFLDFCRDLENETYTIGNYRVNYAVWMTVLECPKCHAQLEIRSMPSEVECKRCSSKMAPRFFYFKEKLLSISLEKNGDFIKTCDEKTLSEYMKQQDGLTSKYWYPEGKFSYPGSGIEFRNGPHRTLEIKEIFTKRNLYVVSRIYDEIEKIWKIDQKQGDVLKLAFIASLANATKMIPHAKSSGPSWKIPRYWIPNIREERNFCKSFIRRLKVIKAFKERLLNFLRDYEVHTVYENPSIQYAENGTNSKVVYVFKSDARDTYEILPKCDFVVLDPPHYDQVDYYELHYLWQKWLYGKLGDERFSDFDYWKYEISINNRVGHDFGYYEKSLSEIVSSYVKILRNRGRLVLILHNRDEAVLEKTVNKIKEGLHGVKIRSKVSWPRVPSSTQGIHGRRKFLYILRVDKMY